MKSPLHPLLFLVSLSLAGASAYAQADTTKKPDDKAKPPTIEHPAEPGVQGKGSVESETVRALLKEFEVKRDGYIAQRQALIDKLKGATEAERKAILEQLHTDQQARVDEQRALAKQIRDELKKLREQRKVGSGG